MKKIRSFIAKLALMASLFSTSISLLASLLSILVFLIIGLILIEGLKIPDSIIGVLVAFGIGLVINSIIAGILVIFQIIREKRAKQPDENTPAIVTKTITIKATASLSYEPIVIEVTDAESAAEVVEALRENIMKHEDQLKAESQLTVEVKEPEEPQQTRFASMNGISPPHTTRKREPEASDVPETKKNKE